MVKYDELHNEDSCLNKAADDEMLFVLRAQDESAPRTILHWISKNFETCPDDKLREAFECALKMKNSQHRKKAD